MAGALMQLVAYGAQDVYLTANPTITYWKAVYRRHTNFAIESMSQSLSGIVNFGNKAVCRISRNGDLMSRTYIQVTLPDLSDYDTYYVNRVGFNLIKSVELRIGGQQIDKHYSDWMHIWTELTHNVDMKDLLDKLVGLKDIDGMSAKQVNPGTLNIPLLFFFCRNPGLAIPLISLQYHEIELWFEFETLVNCLNDRNEYNNVPVSSLSLSNINLWVDYIFLDTEERKEFAQKPHEYLIEIVQNQENSISATGRSSTRLTFNHPTKFITWTLRDTTAECSPFVEIFSGGNTTFGLKYNGTLWAWGNNTDGELGNGQFDSFPRYYHTPIQVGTDTDWVKISVGTFCVFGIKTNGTLWSTGLNLQGQLGLGDNTDRNIFTIVTSPANSIWTDVATSGRHTIAIRNDGTLWSTGINTKGQLGINNTTSKNTFTQETTYATNWIRVFTNIDSFFGGSSYALKSNGILYACGFNNHGQLGINSTTDRTQFVQVNSNVWKEISAGEYHVVGIQDSGVLWAWGINSNYELGTNDITEYRIPHIIDTDTDWNRISCGGHFTLAIKGSALYGWGINSNGQLNNNDYSGTTIQVPTQLGTDTDWAKISTGFYSSFAMKDTLELFATGRNYEGQLGLKYGFATYETYKIPNNNWAQISTSKTCSVGVPVPAYDISEEAYTMAIDNNGYLWTWGFNYHQQNGLGPFSDTVYALPTQVITGGLNTWKSVDAGGYHTVGIKTDGTLWVVGVNNYGQLGTGNYDDTTSWTQIGSATNWIKVSCSAVGTAVLNAAGEIWMTGYNYDGQCGQNTNHTTLGPVFPFPAGYYTNYTSFVKVLGGHTWTDLAAGNFHMIAINNAGHVFTWGLGGSGQLGQGTNNNLALPQQVGSATWLHISGGQFSSYFLRSDYTIWGCGDNTYGELGIGNNTNINYLAQESSGSTWTVMKGGDRSLYGVKADGSLWATGYNSYGQLGLSTNDYPDTTDRNVFTQVGRHRIYTNVYPGPLYAFASDNSDNLWAFGYGLNLGVQFENIYTLTEVPCQSNDIFTNFSGYNNNTNTLASAKLRLNGQDRFAERDGTYFNYIQPYQHFEVKPDTGINVYSFALKPAEHQPSGACNFSRIDNINLDITPTINPENTNNTPLQLSVYAFSYNVLRVASGMGGLAFSN